MDKKLISENSCNSWTKKLINLESPVINGDGSYSRDFTYIENVIQANEKALFTTDENITKGQHEYYNVELENHKYFGKKTENSSSQSRPLTKSPSRKVAPSPPRPLIFSEVFNIAYGGNTNLIELFETLRDNLAKYNKEINKIKPKFGPLRAGDIPHSQASIKKAEMILGYNPVFDARKGFERACEWYFENLK